MDVVVVGEGVCALAAVARAAQDGVRAILAEHGYGLSRSEALLHVADGDLAALGSPPAERSFTADDGAVSHAVAASTVGNLLERAARAAGADVRTAGDRSISVRLDADGWRVSIAGGEPIRAPMLILAESARARSLSDLGIAAAQHMCPDGADVATWAVATWHLPPSELAKHSEPMARLGPGALDRVDVLPGRDRVTVRLGPIWSGGEGWPSASHPRVLGAVARAARALDLPIRASAIELDEARLDALPYPPTFDGGLVAGLGAGHAPRTPQRRAGFSSRLGAEAGRAAAAAILREASSARALGEALGATYRALFDEAVAEMGAPPARVGPVFARLAR